MSTFEIPQVDLAEHKHPIYDEWGWGPRKPDASTWWVRRYRVIGNAEPDLDGYTVSIGGWGVTRDELPSLIGFLAAVYQASDPANAPADGDKQ